MKRLLFLLFLISCSSLYSQNLIQTYVDRCTGEVKVMSVPMNGSTVIAYYNRSRVFTASDFQNGTLQSWLEETYLWWSSLNPCSTNQAQTTTVQTTVQQTTTQATQAATQAAVPVAAPVVAAPQPTPTVNASPPPSSPTPTQSAPQTTSAPVDNSSTSTAAPTTDNGSQVNTNESTPQTDTSGTTETGTGETGTTESTTEASTTETSEPQTETTETESTPSDSGDGETQTSETEDSGTSQNENESDSESTSEVSEEETSTESESSESEESVEESTEESTEESSEESSEETSEEETTEEETTEEESSEEESSEEESESEESEDEESSDESSSEDEEEEEDKDKKKKTFAPPIISANVASMQNIDGTFNQTMTIGVSRSSLLGTETYAINAMVWDNLQQFMLNGSYSKVHINDEGRVNRVYSASLGGARMFTTTMGNMGHSLTYLGKKGAVKGVAFSTSLISVGFQVVEGNIIQDAVLLAPALTGFWTKSFVYSPKLTISPMVAISSPFLLHDWFNNESTWNKDIMAIIGSNFDISLTQRFKFNVGVNTIHNTNSNIPMTWNFTIGSRFSL